MQRVVFRRAGVAEWSIASDCKSDARTGYIGSNPVPSTQYQLKTAFETNL